MGAYIGPPTNFVRRAGDTMTGNLAMAVGLTVDGVDVSEVKQAKIITGTYIGNGVDNRNIDIGVDLTAKNNVYIAIKSAEIAKGVHRIEYSQGDLTMSYDASGDIADWIQALTSTGFQIGAANWVNQNTTTFRYIVIYEEP